MTDTPPEASFPAPGGRARLVLSTAPPDQAHALARALVDERLAACVNLVSGVRSIYRWRGEVCDDPETLLLIKTREDRLAALGRRLQELHPYEVPELLALEPSALSEGYRTWLEDQMGPSE